MKLAFNKRSGAVVMSEGLGAAVVASVGSILTQLSGHVSPDTLFF